MKKRIKFKTFGKPIPGDPTGSSTQGTNPEIVDAYLLEDGRIELEPNYIIPGQEGDNPGNYRHLSDTDKSELLSLRKSLQTLAGNANQDIAVTASAILAKLTGNNRVTVLRNLLTIANNSGATATRRINAIILIGIIIEDVV